MFIMIDMYFDQMGLSHCKMGPKQVEAEMKTLCSFQKAIN